MRIDPNFNDEQNPADILTGVTKLDTLPSWGGGEKTDTRLPITDYSTLGGSRPTNSPYPLSKDVNNRFILWDGDITKLEVDIITNVIDEGLINDNDNWPNEQQQIYNIAGSQLKEELTNNIKDFPRDGVYVTRGYNLPAKHVLHVVGPTFKENVKTASEDILFTCYSEILSKAEKLNQRTIAICNISANSPTDLVAHIALQKIRRYLDKHPTQIVIMCTKVEERGVYEVLAPLYFPRDVLEERTAISQMPRSESDPTGSGLNADREIRITANPQHHYGGESDDDDVNIDDAEVDDYELSNLRDRQVEAYWDKEHLLGPQTVVRTQLLNEDLERQEPDRHHQMQYERLLRRAQTEDLTEVEGIGCLKVSGVDRLGRPVVYFHGKWFPAKDIDLEKALLYLIKLLDPIVKNNYVVIYAHTLTSTANYPPLFWLREVYDVLPYKYKKNLKAFYIIHPTFWTRMVTWWFTTFMAPAIKEKVHSLYGIEYLYSAIQRSELDFPGYVVDYDLATYGQCYAKPAS